MELGFSLSLDFSATFTVNQMVKDLDLILDIPVTLTVELGRTKIPIKHILQLERPGIIQGGKNSSTCAGTRNCLALAGTRQLK